MNKVFAAVVIFWQYTDRRLVKVATFRARSLAKYGQTIFDPTTVTYFHACLLTSPQCHLITSPSFGQFYYRQRKFSF